MTNMTKRVGFTVLLALAAAHAQTEGRILRPTDGAALPPGETSIIATAPAGKLEIDGKPLAAEETAPGVFQTKVNLSPGVHTLAMSWEGGRTQVRFFAGPNPPAEFKAFQLHPPVQVECTQCHALSRRGRFTFKGGCFDCHQQTAFPKTHQHTPDVLENCGQCHNAHGSTEKFHLMFPREKACKLCHN
jgi:predicted CXXCH cytochrome family protein